MFSVCRFDKISFMRRVHRVTSNLSLGSFTITYTLPTLLSAPFHSSDIEYERQLTTQNYNYRGEPILLRRPGRPHTHRNCHRNAVGLHGGGHGRPHDHGGCLGRPHDHGGCLGRPHDHRFRVGIVKIFKMGMPMVIPMGVPMGVPTDVPMVVLMCVPMGVPMGFFFMKN